MSLLDLRPLKEIIKDTMMGNVKLMLYKMTETELKLIFTKNPEERELIIRALSLPYKVKNIEINKKAKKIIIEYEE